jgi:hypothetical protein
VSRAGNPVTLAESSAPTCVRDGQPAVLRTLLQEWREHGRARHIAERGLLASVDAEVEEFTLERVYRVGIFFKITLREGVR